MKLLFCCDRAANYVEMASLLKALSANGHQCSLLLPLNLSRAKSKQKEKQLIEAAQTEKAINKIIELDLYAIKQQAKQSLGTRTKTDRPLESNKKKRRISVEKLLTSALLPTYQWLQLKQIPLVSALPGIYFGLWSLRRRIPSKLRAVTKRLRTRSKLLAVLAFRWRNNQLHYFFYAGFIEQLRILFRDTTFDAVILPEEVVGMVWECLVKTSNEFAIPVFVCPYTIANQQEPFESLRDREEFQTRNNWLVAHVFPRWRMKQEDRDLVRLPEPDILAHERHKLTPRDPWLMNSGFIQALCVESTANRDYFVNSGIPSEQIHVTGSAALDEMYRIRQHRHAITTELSQEMGYENERPLLLISGCPNQLTNCPYCEHSSMEHIADFLSTTLAPLMATYCCIVRPHPANLEFGDMLAQHGVHASALPTAKLIAVSDLFIAFASSTIRWAVCCGIPTVNYDVFHFDYREYQDTVGVFNVQTKRAFEDVTSQLSFGSPLYRETRSAIEHTQQGSDTTFDGQSVSRIEGLLQSTIAQKTRQTLSS